MNRTLAGAMLVSIGSIIIFAWEYLTRRLYDYRLKELGGVEGGVDEQLPSYLLGLGKCVLIIGLILIIMDIRAHFKRTDGK